MGNDNRQPRTSTKNPAAAKVNQASAAEGEPKNIGEAILRIYAAVPYIRKRGTMGSGKGYRYVRDTDVIAAVRNPMIANKVILTGPHEIKNRTLTEISTGGGSKMFRCDAEYLYRLEHVPSQTTKDVWVNAEGADSLDKGSNKCNSAGRKYALLLGFNITTGDDPDQFDEQGHFGGPSEDEDDHTGQEPPQQSQPTTVKPASNGQKAEPKKEAAKTETKQEPKAGSHLPANGKELHERLTDYGAKLAKSGVCAAGELVAHVTQTGVKAGYPVDMNLWEPVAISAAVEWVKTFEADKRAAKAEPKQEPKKEEPKAEPTKPDDKFNVLKNSGTASEAAKPAPAPTQAPAATTPAPAQAQAPAQTGPTAAERYAKRIAGMNASNKKENLDAFRAKYSEDKEMTAEQIGELEKTYWKNVERVTGKKLAETART